MLNYAPDALGHATEVGSLAHALTWNAAGKLTGYTAANGVTAEYGYNLRGLRSRTRYARMAPRQASSI